MAAREIMGAVRAALVDLLTQGPWDAIESDHGRVGLAWRPDLQPGWGKPKYVKAVLSELGDADVVALARRCMDVLTDRSRAALQDALWWLDAGGVAVVSEITRRTIAHELEGRVMTRDEDPAAFLSRVADRSRGWTSLPTLTYGDDGLLYESKVDFLALFGGAPSALTYNRRSHAELLREHGFFEWPDKRLFLFLEQLVHPNVRRDTAEQDEWVSFLNAILDADGLHLIETSKLSRRPLFSVQRRSYASGRKPKNLIFASRGPKPELGFADALDNDVVILKHAEHCLIYEETIGDAGLSWDTLVSWWAQREGGDSSAARKSLGQRLLQSLGSPVERALFAEYFRQFSQRLGERLPALLPQVYLHYDPVSLRELQRRGEERRFLVQRMDFLLLLRDHVRVVVEVDGQQHYSEGEGTSARPSPALYADTVKSDCARRRIVIAHFGAS
jgi:hypothetical protein